MSIWSSTFTLWPDGEHGAAYSDFVAGDGYYTTATPESLATTPRDAFLDVATSGMCDLVRVSIEADGDTAQVWLDRSQVTALAEALALVSAVRGTLDAGTDRSRT